MRRSGRYYCGYSGGNYTGAYGTGEAVAHGAAWTLRRFSWPGRADFRHVPGLIEGPGHFSVVQPDLIHDWIACTADHPHEAVRRVWLCPASWGPAGVVIGELSDQPQPAPVLAHRTISSSAPAAAMAPRGWSIEKGDWGQTPMDYGMSRRDRG